MAVNPANPDQPIAQPTPMPTDHPSTPMSPMTSQEPQHDAMRAQALTSQDAMRGTWLGSGDE